VTRNANSVKNALEKFPINFDNDETDRWGEEVAGQPSSKHEALTSTRYTERATSAPLLQTGGFIEIAKPIEKKRTRLQCGWLRTTVIRQLWTRGSSVGGNAWRGQRERIAKRNAAVRMRFAGRE
jgi:hypothetical protein